MEPISYEAARLTGVADGWAGRYRTDLTRDQALAALHAISTDPERLGEAAATYVTRRPALDWHEAAQQLLVDAGADPVAVERYAEQRRNRRSGGFDLGQMAEGVNRMPSAHG